MMNYKFVKELLNPKFFELPPSPLKNKLACFSLGYSNNKIEEFSPTIYLCNKTSIFDKHLISNSLTCDFVFLKDEIIKKLYYKKLLAEDKKELLSELSELKKQYVSVVIFPEKNISVFGETDDISIEVTDFLYEAEYDIKFVTLIGTYFVAPVWSPFTRKGKTKFNSQFSLDTAKFKKLNKTEFNELVNNYMPSSASVYAERFYLELRSNKLAHNLETIVYCCPKCEKFFNLYSEFNCVKCKNCGSAFELQPNGSILLAKNINNFDELKEFQFEKLYKSEFSKLPLVTYKDVCRCEKYSNNKIEVVGNCDMTIFFDKIELVKNQFSVTHKIKEIINVEMREKNTVCITLNSGENFYYKGNNKENFYIIHDLVEILNQ